MYIVTIRIVFYSGRYRPHFHFFLSLTTVVRNCFMLNAGFYIFSGSVITSLIMDTIEYLNGEVKKGHF